MATAAGTLLDPSSVEERKEFDFWVSPLGSRRLAP